MHARQLRDTFRAVLEPWFDFEDTTLHGVKSNAPAKFAVDTEKRDAILEAYKVCRTFLQLSRDSQ